MKLFLTIVILHFLEHLAQIYQLYIFHLARADCLGILGLWQPMLIRSEWLHFGYALVMLIGLYLFKHQVKSKSWWTTTIYLQWFHYFEHWLLIVQALLGVAMVHRTSIGGLWFPRIELHFFYNLMVFVPMAIALIKNRPGVSI